MKQPFAGWNKANERRHVLIVKKHQGGGLTADEEREFKMLQTIAEAVMNYVSPPFRSHLSMRIIKALK